MLLQSCDALFIVVLLSQIYGESDREAIIELSRNVSLGLIALSIAAGFFYFAGVTSLTVVSSP